MTDDLISRSELRKRFQAILDRGDMFCEYDIIGMVDNAPPVSIDWGIDNGDRTVYAISQGERVKRALAIIDRLRADEHINNKEQGTLRRAILLPERPQGEWQLHGMIYYCSECGHECGESGDNFCGNCGADMRGGSQ